MSFVIVLLLLLLAGLALFVLVGGPKLPPDTDRAITRVLARELPELVTGRTGYASNAGLKLWYECRSPAGPAKGTVLLEMALRGDALMWPPSFLNALVEAGYQVIRYDHRGTGLSDWMVTWNRQQLYTLADMAGDAVAVLDALQIDQAHVVGLSMSSMIAQELAIGRPDRVASLTLLMTSGDVGDPELPGLTSRSFFSALVQGLPLLKYRLAGGERNLIKERIAKTALVLRGEEMDLDALAEVVLYDLRQRRGLNVRAVFQHLVAISVSAPRHDRLRTLAVPTLIIHGTADPVNPVEHGKKLAAVIPKATGLWLERAGHVFPLPNMPAVMQHLLRHLDQSQA